MESNAGGMVRRPALKTGFSEMGWGSTPLLSAIYVAELQQLKKVVDCPANCKYN